MEKHQSKPVELHLMRGEGMTFESLMALGEKLLGRKASPEEWKHLKKRWDEHLEKLMTEQGPHTA